MQPVFSEIQKVIQITGTQRLSLNCIFPNLWPEIYWGNKVGPLLVSDKPVSVIQETPIKPVLCLKVLIDRLGKGRE